MAVRLPERSHIRLEVWLTRAVDRLQRHVERLWITGIAGAGRGRAGERSGMGGLAEGIYDCVNAGLDLMQEGGGTMGTARVRDCADNEGQDGNGWVRTGMVDTGCRGGMQGSDTAWQGAPGECSELTIASEAWL